MVFLINSLPVFIVLIMGLVIRYSVPSKIGKVFMSLLTVVLLLTYFQIQPSYMPKGTVKPMKTVEFKQLDIPIVDRSLKPKSSEQYDAERIAEMEAIDKSIKNQIKLNKE